MHASKDWDCFRMRAESWSNEQYKAQIRIHSFLRNRKPQKLWVNPKVNKFKTNHFEEPFQVKFTGLTVLREKTKRPTLSVMQSERVFRRNRCLMLWNTKRLSFPQSMGVWIPALQPVVDSAVWEQQRAVMNPPRLFKWLKVPLKCTEMREPHNLQDER